MSFKKVQKIPEPAEIIEALPISEDVRKIKKARDREIAEIFTGESERFLMIVGPCSADNEESVISYISRLAEVQEKVKDRMMIVPRIYTNKPRTTGEGYKGMLHQPDPEKKPNLVEGILAIRKMHIRAIRESGMVCADEMLYPENYEYLEDLLGYIAVGARSVENQQHRLTVSGTYMPVGMKNPTSGDISIMLNAIRAAQGEHTFIFRGWEVNTDGNPLTHAIMRGAVDKFGKSIANYHYEDIIYLIEEYEKRKLKHPAIIVDTNHSNSDKQFAQQPRIAMEVVRNRQYDSRVRQYVKGLMVESYLEEGRQEIGENTFGKSITDPCLGWDATERMIYDLAELV